MRSLAGENTQLRIFVNSLRRHHGQPVYESLVILARRQGLAGVTVLEGIEGFAQNQPVATPHAWELTESREVILELVDSRDRLEAFLGDAGALLADCIVTFERAKVVYYGAEAKP